MRLQMSRPRLSVPSQYAALGGLMRAPRMVSSVACGAMRSAKTAITSMATTMTAPKAPSGFRRANRTSAGLVADAGIEDGIERVHGQIHEDDGGHDDEVDALDDGIVALGDRLEEEAAHAGQPKDRLDDDGTAEDLRDLDAEHGEDGNEGVLQAMLEHDGPFAEPLRPGGAHVVLPQHLEEHGSREPHEGRAGGNAEDEAGQEELHEVAAGIAAELHVLRHRTPAPPVRREDEDECGQPEAGHGEPEDGRAAREVVADRV